MQTKNFRDDINGLRAYAVILVVLYHFGVSGFSAGFLGVDVFFVISGYLMSKIIIENLEKNSFSFINFYLARITRIFPALFFVVIVMTICGWFFSFQKILNYLPKMQNIVCLSCQMTYIIVKQVIILL
ncbi:acyltransferase [Acinetobacter bereziniae]|nr:acyltransferase [Acinetobacter bereziniae]